METSYPTVTHEISRPVDEDTHLLPTWPRGLVDCTNMADGRDQSDHLQSPTSAGLDTTYRAPQERELHDLDGRSVS